MKKHVEPSRIKLIRFIFCFSIFAFTNLFADATIYTWNLFNFGKAKLAKEDAMDYIAETLKNADITTIQEVSTGIYGAKAVATLVDLLNRKGAKWDYRVSEPTTGDGSERYAIIFKPSKAKLIGKPWLEQTLEERINREPFMARFRISETAKNDCADRRCILIATFHAVPTAKDPASEIELLSELKTLYPEDNIILTGDFNLSEKDSAFDGLKKKGLLPCLKNQKTSLRVREKDGEHLAKEYDNIFFESSTLAFSSCKAVDFVTDFEDLRAAHNISDHLPVFMNVDWLAPLKEIKPEAVEVPATP